ncbi:hypothetical protein TSAR_000578 [Trichomalopsis sarcophagae]|uniref:Transmembrane protein 177 n=1 Tax=Trichomalopsis sarcophagae TaxID=543379 RepID=A0A232EJM1_9HYME|nr:hypothetical protein TSAR_000578 [Trichomalopsis sarcophagae]
MNAFTTRVPPTRFGILATGAAVTATVAASLIELLPHTFFLEKFKNIVRIYRLGEEIPLQHEVEDLFKEVLDDLKIKDTIRKKLTAFPIVGFNLYHAGMADSQYGAIIGIPINYLYKDKFSIDTSDIRMGRDREPINMYHPAAENLLESLVLSKNAQKFGIAREVLMAHKDLPLFRSIQSPFMVASSILIADFFRVKYNIMRKSLVCMVYGTSALIGYAIWFQTRDILTTYTEKEVDKELSKLGPEYIQGGKEFYDKILKRNVATRILLGTEGSRQFNRDGDEIFFIRHKRTPITHRKRFFSELKLEGEKAPA